MDKPRMPVHYLPPLPEVRELDEHGNDTNEPEKRPDPWISQLQAQANSPAIEKKWANSNDITTKPIVEIYEWPDFSK